jgi:hypothetical protein
MIERLVRKWRPTGYVDFTIFLRTCNQAVTATEHSP